jgi:hypothetical protein
VQIHYIIVEATLAEFSEFWLLPGSDIVGFRGDGATPEDNKDAKQLLSNSAELLNRLETYVTNAVYNGRRATRWGL